MLSSPTRWETIMEHNVNALHREPWNKGKIVGQKAPFNVKDIWALRVRLQMEKRVRSLRSSTWESTASSAAVTLYLSRSAISATAIKSHFARW